MVPPEVEVVVLGVLVTAKMRPSKDKRRRSTVCTADLRMLLDYLPLAAPRTVEPGLWMNHPHTGPGRLPSQIQKSPPERDPERLVIGTPFK